MSTSTASVPKAVLYAFPAGSVWAAVPLLTALEKGFTTEQLEQRTVDLLKGENFSPSFLKVSPEGTVPALVVPYDHTLSDEIPTKYRSLTSTVEICAFLDASTLPAAHSAPSLSPATVSGNTDSKFLIELVHKADAPDPNFFMLSARNDAERKQKLDGLVGHFLEGRQKALESYSKEAGSDARLAAFYKRKTEENGGLLKIYKGDADAAGFYEVGKKAWTDLAKTLLALESHLSNETYAVGDQISLADLHVGAYLTRILASAGAKSLDAEAAFAGLEKELGSSGKVGPKVKNLVKNLWERESFKQVYKDGPH